MLNSELARSLVGLEAVLLPIPLGTKSPMFPGWQKLTLAQTQDPKFKLNTVPSRDGHVPPRPRFYAVELEKGNIGVLQGRPSKGLVSIDIDDDADIAAFLELNPIMAGTLQTRGARGRNFWFRVPYDEGIPIVSADYFRDGIKVYEFRADGRQTVIFGRHPSGSTYSVVHNAPILEIPGFDLPDNLDAPKMVSSKDELMELVPMLNSGRLARRRGVLENILGEIEWISPIQGIVEVCPGHSMHTNATAHGHTWIFADGAPTLHCFHSSCRSHVEEVNTILRERISETERLQLPDGIVTRDQTAEALFSRIADEKAMFCRGGKIICEVMIRKDVNKGSTDVSLSNMTDVAAVSRFERYAQFVQKKIELSEADPETGKKTRKVGYSPKKLGVGDAKELLSCSAAFSMLPPLDTVLACPIIKAKDIVPDVRTTGYHEDLAVYINYDGVLTEVPFEEAKAALLDFGSEYCFCSEADRARFIAALLTPALVHGNLISDNQTPVFIVDANKRGAGKTELAKAITKIYSADPYLVTQKNGGVGSWDESLNTGLSYGENFLLMDNLRGRVDSQFLESFVTSKSKVPVRIPGQAEVTLDASKVIVFGTSNGFQATTDLADRACFINIVKQNDAFEFKNSSLISFAGANQPYLLSCVFSIISHWIADGCQRSTTKEHRMRDWARVCDYIVTNYFNMDCGLLKDHKLSQKSTADGKLSWFIQMSRLAETEEKHGVWMRCSALAELCMTESVYPPGISRSSIGDIPSIAKSIGHTMKAAFKDTDAVKLAQSTLYRHQFTGSQGTYVAYAFSTNGKPVLIAATDEKPVRVSFGSKDRQEDDFEPAEPLDVNEPF